MKLYNVIISFTMTILSLSALSQQVKDTPKLKQPKMESFWGGFKGGKLNVNIVNEILDSAIFVIAEKKEKLTISRAILVYRSKDIIEDEETGIIKTKFNSTSYNYINNDTLPQSWRNFLKENIKPGDQIQIADIIVRDKRKNLFNAGDIKIFIE